MNGARERRIAVVGGGRGGLLAAVHLHLEGARVLLFTEPEADLRGDGPAPLADPAGEASPELLERIPARVVGLEPDAAGIQIELDGGEERRADAAVVVRAAPSLLDSLRLAGLLRIPAEGTGPETGPEGALIEECGRTSDRLFALGALHTGEPDERHPFNDLQEQARRLAGHLTRRPDPPAPEAVTRTYLTLDSPGELRPVPAPPVLPRLERSEPADPALARRLYRRVGRHFRWADRLAWSDEQWRERFARPEVTLWVLEHDGRLAGYFELERHPDGSVEVAYFGLCPEFLGRGLGGWLLTEAVVRAWELCPTRVWLHTCELDHPAALPNYLRRGFRIERTEPYVPSV